LPSKDKSGVFSPFYEFCPKKTVGALLFVRFERGPTTLNVIVSKRPIVHHLIYCTVQLAFNLYLIQHIWYVRLFSTGIVYRNLLSYRFSK
jgi:hypothetical protein